MSLSSPNLLPGTSRHTTQVKIPTNVFWSLWHSHSNSPHPETWINIKMISRVYFDNAEYFRNFLGQKNLKLDWTTYWIAGSDDYWRYYIPHLTRVSNFRVKASPNSKRPIWPQEGAKTHVNPTPPLWESNHIWIYEYIQKEHITSRMISKEMKMIHNRNVTVFTAW